MEWWSTIGHQLSVISHQSVGPVQVLDNQWTRNRERRKIVQKRSPALSRTLQKLAKETKGRQTAAGTADPCRILVLQMGSFGKKRLFIEPLSDTSTASSTATDRDSNVCFEFL